MDAARPAGLGLPIKVPSVRFLIRLIRLLLFAVGLAFWPPLYSGSSSLFTLCRDGCALVAARRSAV